MAGQASVLTSRNDNSRTGRNDNEPFLNSTNVTTASFAKLGAYSVDGFVVAQPLYVPNISIAGSIHNVVFVATQHDSVYAFDADNPASGVPLWYDNFTNPSAGITSVPIADQGCAAVNGYFEMGIQGTPVIDLASSTLYVDVKTKEVSGSATNYVHRLHALDISTGQEKFGSPVQITGSVQSSHGIVNFDSLKGCQRPGLLLSQGVVYVAFGSSGCDNTHGWVFAYALDSTMTLTQKGVFNTTPNQTKGGSVWQGGAGLASDDNGNIFFITANGTFNANTGGSDYGDSFLKVTLGPGSLNLGDYFTPFDQSTMASNDLDLGSGGITLLPTGVGSTDHPTLAIGAGKTGTIYLVDQSNLGHFQPSNNNQIVEWLQGVLSEVEGSPAYWNGLVYFSPVHSSTKAYSISNATLSDQPIAQTQSFSAIGAPAISANGNTNGLLWLVRQSGANDAVLSAFDATKLNELYNTAQNPSRDDLGPVAHFITPTIANGKVFVGTQTQLGIYGLLPVLSPLTGGNQTAAAGSTLPTAITVQALNPYTGAPFSGVVVTFSDGGKGGIFGSPTATTDSTGEASTTYIMPTTFKKSTITINATSSGYASGTFVETIVAGNPASITLVSGGSQTGTVGTTLAAPIAVKVMDSFGNGVPGIPISFSANVLGGVFNPPSPVTTDSLGRATVSYTLPTIAKTITITAANGTLSKLINERSIAGPATSMSIASGNNQSANRHTALPKPLVVKITDQYANPVAGVTITFTDNGAGGTISSATAITNAMGQASVTYTTGNKSMAVVITGSATGLTSVNFNETVL
jgi:hypothetical protein